jgi:hypothetical protein
MNLSDARAALAAAVSTMDGVTAVAHPVPGNLRVGDAWITVGRRVYAPRLRHHLVTLSAFVCLGSNEQDADLKIDAWSGSLLDSVIDLFAGDVSVEPQEIITTTPTPASVFALVLSATFELSD